MKINNMGKRIDITTFIINSKLIHGDKYDYTLVEFNRYGNKVKIICPEHGIFEQLPQKHIGRKQGCPNCSITKKITNEKFIEKSKLIHGDKYDYSLCNYKNAKTKVKIICKIHGIFEQISSSHTDQKTGCPICSKKHNYNNDEFIEKSILLHGNKYDYSEVNYINNYTKIKIKCEKHGYFTQTPSNHLSGKGCELCNSSKNENLISLYLTNNNITFNRQHKFIECRHERVLPFDFYLPDYNTCIEFQGRQHYEPIEFFGGYNGFIKQQKRDNIKKKYCDKNDIKLLLIKYNDDILDILPLQFK
jgi:hypothetical protein